MSADILMPVSFRRLQAVSTGYSDSRIADYGKTTAMSREPVTSFSSFGIHLMDFQARRTAKPIMQVSLKKLKTVLFILLRAIPAIAVAKITMSWATTKSSATGHPPRKDQPRLRLIHMFQRMFTFAALHSSR